MMIEVSIFLLTYILVIISHIDLLLTDGDTMTANMRTFLHTYLLTYLLNYTPIYC